MSTYPTPTYPTTDTLQPTSTMGYQQPGFPQTGYQQLGFPQTGYQPPIYPQTGYQPPTFSQMPGFQQQIPGYQPPIGPTGYTGVPLTHTGFIPVQESYIENILRLNKNKIATVYMNFDNSQWGSKIFKGAIEAAGKDHIILRDPVTNMRYLLLSIFLNYITFDEEISYEYPFAAPNIPGVAPGTQLRKKENKDQNANK